jgi:flagellar basal-body rod protein FlgF
LAATSAREPSSRRAATWTSASRAKAPSSPSTTEPPTPIPATAPSPWIPTGKLVTKAGLAVQGDGGDIILDPAKGAPVVGEDGTISQNGALVGKLTLARFDTLAALSKDGDGLYRNRSNATPIDATGAKIRQGALEASNVNPLTEITSMIEISRAYEQATKMIENVNDLSKRAVERLGRPN